MWLGFSEWERTGWRCWHGIRQYAHQAHLTFLPAAHHPEVGNEDFGLYCCTSPVLYPGYFLTFLAPALAGTFARGHVDLDLEHWVLALGALDARGVREAHFVLSQFLDQQSL